MLLLFYDDQVDFTNLDHISILAPSMLELMLQHLGGMWLMMIAVLGIVLEDQEGLVCADDVILVVALKVCLEMG